MNDELENRFRYHKPDDAKVSMHQDIRTGCRDLAELISESVPDGREKALALTKLEEVMFWSNAAIARH